MKNYLVVLMFLMSPIALGTQFSELTLKGKIDQFNEKDVSIWLNPVVRCQIKRELISENTELHEGRPLYLKLSETQIASVFKTCKKTARAKIK